MGKSGGGGSKTTETALSREQADILKSREAFYQEFTKQELVDYYNDTKGFELNKDFQSLDRIDFANQSMANIDRAYAVQQDNLSNELARRGMEGSGVEASALTQLMGNKANDKATAYNQGIAQEVAQTNQVIGMQNNANLQEQGVRQGGLNSLLSQAPRPTTAAPMGQKNEAPSLGGQLLAGAAGGATKALTGGLF